MKVIGKTGIVAGAVVLFGTTCLATYNRMVRLDDRADARWSQVEQAYRERAELVPELIAMTGDDQVSRALAQVRRDEAPTTALAFEKYQYAQDRLDTAVQRSLDSVDFELRASERFRGLERRLAAADDRIARERATFTEDARAFNRARARFPTVIVGALFDRFDPKPAFSSTGGNAEVL